MNLLASRLRSVEGCQSNRLGGIRGGTQRVRGHMSDACSLPRGFRRCHRRGAAHLTSGGIPNETAADLVGYAKLTTSKGPGPSDGITGAGIPGSLRLEQSQHPLRAIRRPHRNNSSVSPAQRLRRAHTHILPGAPGQQEELELTFNHDGRSYDLGTAYGHIAIGVDRSVRPYRVCEGGSRLCFVRDPADQYRVELIERGG